MIVNDLDGNSINWQLIGHTPKIGASKSSLHLRARSLLSIIYPTMQILEEVPIYVRRSEVLYMDFYLPLKKTCIETHGEQHYKFVSHYHSNALGFMRHKKRDREKQEWCEINGITYIELPFNESDDQWKLRIEQPKSN